MMEPCIICYKLSSSSSFNNDREAITKFFNLMGRHLQNEIQMRQDVNGKELLVPMFKDLINSGLQPCEDCSNLIESFCELYHEMKSIELLLNWKVLTIKNVMMGAQMSTHRLKELSAGATQLNGVDANDILQSKAQLIQICEQNLRASLPKVELRRYKSNDHTLLQKNDKSYLGNPSLNSDDPGMEMKPNDVKKRTKSNVNCTFLLGNIKLSNDFQPDKNILSTSAISTIKDNVLRAPTKIQVKRESKPLRVKFAAPSPHYVRQGIKMESNNTPMLQDDMEQNCDWTELTDTKIFSSKDKLKIHRESQNKEGDCLGRVPDEFSSSRPQSQINLETGKIDCGICKRGFLTETGFLYHWNGIHLGLRYNCPHPQCKTSFVQPSGLKFHLKTTHNSKRRQFKCPTCSKIFASKQYLGIHQASVHSGTRNKNNQCKFCSKYFSTPITMRVHMRSYCPVVLKVETDYQGLPRQKRKFNVKPKSQSGINPERQPSKYSTEAIVMDYSIYGSTR